MSETFVILGASSFYGSNFANLVEAKGDKAVRLSRPEWKLGDELMPKAEYVVNFASRNLVAESWDDPSGYCQTNVADTAKTLDYLKSAEIRRFVHVSTPEVYGHTPYWVGEDDPEFKWNPTTPYAVSRAAADMMVKAYWRAYQIPAIITRTANIYGPDQPEHRIIPKAIAYKRSGEVLSLEGDGASVRSFIHVMDACEATYLVAKRGDVGETYHISSKPAYTIKQVVQKIGCRYRTAPERRGKDQAYLLDDEKIRTQLGWTDKISLDQGLKECESYRSS